MSDAIQKIENAVEHIQLVQCAGIKLAKRLALKGDITLARLLLARVFTHDASKFSSEEEFNNLNGFVESEENLQIAIDHHRKNNPHHPEFHGGIYGMYSVDIAEFVCDIWARCAITGQDIRKWINEEGVKRYGLCIGDPVHTSIYYFISALLDRPCQRIN